MSPPSELEKLKLEISPFADGTSREELGERPMTAEVRVPESHPRLDPLRNSVLVEFTNLKKNRGE